MKTLNKHLSFSISVRLLFIYLLAFHSSVGLAECPKSSKLCAWVKKNAGEFLYANLINEVPLSFCQLIRDMKSPDPECGAWNEIIYNCSYDLACDVVTRNFEWLPEDFKNCVMTFPNAEEAYNSCYNNRTNTLCDQMLSNNDQDGGACTRDRDCRRNFANYPYFCIDGRCKRRSVEGQYCTPDGEVVPNGTGNPETKPPPYCKDGLYCHCNWTKAENSFWTNPVKRCSCKAP